MDAASAIIETAIKFQRQGRLEEAEAIYREILKIEPSHVGAMHNLGLVFHSNGKYKEAVEIIGKAIIQSPEVADLHSNIAASQLALGLPISAATHATKAIELDFNLGEAHYNLGNAQFSLGKTNDASRSFQYAVELNPKNDHFWSNYLFALNFSPSTDQKEIFKANCRWGLSLNHHEDEITFNNDFNPDRPLRLAYFLPELERHVTARFLSAMLEHHNRSQFEILIYGYAENRGPAPKSLSNFADGWIDVADLTIDLVAERMRRDQVDILLHPCTFKARYRKLIFHNAAPLQVACINLVSTTGLGRTTHLVTDPFLSPPDETEHFFTETLIRLSGFNVYQKPEHAPDVAPLPAIKNNYIVFGSCNNPAKLTTDCLSLWTNILKSIPSSHLLLKHQSFDNTETCESFSNQFRKMGISRDRLIFLGYTQDINQYLEAYSLIDISLDPMPFGGGATTYESTWMGVPVLTMVGEGIMGRLTGSIMTRLGYPEFVTYSHDAYVSRAIEIVSDISKLSEIRQNLRIAANTYIFDAANYVGELESACRDIWIKYCNDNLVKN